MRQQARDAGGRGATRRRAVCGALAALLMALGMVGCARGPGPSSAEALRKWALWSATESRLRGANIYQRRAYARLGDADSFGAGEAVGPRYVQADFDALAAHGANYVNLSHPGIFTETPPYELDGPVLSNLVALVEGAAQAGLHVVISFRTGPGRSEFAILRSGAGDWFPAEMINDDVWRDPTAQQGWAKMWRATAARFADHPAVVGYNLMMEPNAMVTVPGGTLQDPLDFYSRYGGTTYDWNQLHPRLVAAVREVDRATPVLISAEAYGSPYWLHALKTVDDPRAVYVVHQYSPASYTHQPVQAEGMGLRYPQRPAIGQRSGFDRSWLASEYRRLSAFSRRHGVPVTVGEAGIKRWQPGAADFMQDQLEIMEEQGVNYALWIWECADLSYSRAVTDFNFRLGPDPKNSDRETTNGLLSVVMSFWARNHGDAPSGSAAD